MTENERVKQLRTTRGLTLEKFGERVGVSRSAMSNIELGNRAVTDQMRRSICLAFGVREEWLRDGIGEMENSGEFIDLDELADRYNASDLERRLVKAYFELDEPMRRMVMEKLKSAFFSSGDFAESEATELAHQILQDKKAEGGSPASNGDAGKGKMA